MAGSATWTIIFPYTRFATSMIHEPDTTPCSDGGHCVPAQRTAGVGWLETSGVASGARRKYMVSVVFLIYLPCLTLAVRNSCCIIVALRFVGQEKGLVNSLPYNK